MSLVSCPLPGIQGSQKSASCYQEAARCQLGCCCPCPSGTRLPRPAGRVPALSSHLLALGRGAVGSKRTETSDIKKDSLPSTGRVPSGTSHGGRLTWAEMFPFQILSTFTESSSTPGTARRPRAVTSPRCGESSGAP